MRIAIAGMGLIGGSFYKAARRAGHDVTGFDRGDAVDVAAADLVIVALPPDVTAPWIETHAPEFRDGALVMDVCGVKGPVLAAMERLAPKRWTFIGGHPMAGREVSGFANATPDLFKGASMILVPPSGADSERTEAAVGVLKGLFAELGFGRTVVTDAAHHDAMIAFTSQLCHVIASAYAQDARVKDAVGYSAGSYANMTRIATMDPRTWASLFLEDRKPLLEVLDGFIGRLEEFRSALAAADRPALERYIETGARAKREELDARSRA